MKLPPPPPPAPTTAAPAAPPKPFWVSLFLFGLPGRGAAFACFWLSLVIGILGAAINFGIGQPGWGVALAVYAVLSSVGYGETIKWMDRHEAWDR